MLSDFLFVATCLHRQLINQFILLTNVLTQVPKFDQDDLELAGTGQLFKLFLVLAHTPFHQFIVETLPVHVQILVL